MTWLYPAADGGTVTNSAGDDAAIPMANGTTAGLSLNDFTDARRSWTALTSARTWRVVTTSVTNDAGYLTEVPVNPPSDTEPATLVMVTFGLTFQLSACLKIYVDDAECPGDGGWQEIEGGGSRLILPLMTVTTTYAHSSWFWHDLDPYVLTAAG